MPFEDTVNKAVIRQLWDKPVLERHVQNNGRLLSYFGLPGPELHDLLDWKGLIGQKTAIESIGNTKRQRNAAEETTGQLLTNVMIHQISSGFQLMRGDVEDVIIDGIDRDGRPPQLSDGRPAHLMKLSYDVINLDFDGGLGYCNSRGEAKRTTAIKKLFERQAGHSFVFFLTINIRDTLGTEIDLYLKGLRRRDYGPDWANQVEWHLSRPDGEREYKLKATVPSFIHSVAEPHMFKSVCRPPIVYDGHQHARMVHFVFELLAQPGNLRSFSDQDERSLIALPLIRCRNGELSLARAANVMFEIDEISDSLSFLPRTLAEEILTRT